VVTTAAFTSALDPDLIQAGAAPEAFEVMVTLQRKADPPPSGSRGPVRSPGWSGSTAFPRLYWCAMEAVSSKLTYADLLALPEDGKRHELIDGELYVTPSATPRHQLVLGHLHLELAAFVEANELGQVFFAPLDIVLSDFDVVEPDLLFVSRERSERIDKAYVRGAPDLVVEVLSPTTRKMDATRKLRLYEKFGVAEYWMIDPEHEWVEVYRPGPGGLHQIARLLRERGDGPLASPLFPRFALALDRLFR
jgi:Uma2 family endonuclease